MKDKIGSVFEAIAGIALFALLLWGMSQLGPVVDALFGQDPPPERQQPIYCQAMSGYVDGVYLEVPNRCP